MNLSTTGEQKKGREITIPENVVLLDLFRDVTVNKLREMVFGTEDRGQPLFALDYYVSPEEGFEEEETDVIYSNSGQVLGYRYDLEGITNINIDHHADRQEMYREISSTNLAIEYVKKFGILPTEAVVAINHTDCDSVLSSLIMTGKIPPDDCFGRAAIAADHTGEENLIADLINALEQKRDFAYSVSCLNTLLNNPKGLEALPEEAQRLFYERQQQRNEVAQLVREGRLENLGSDVYFGQFDDNIRAEFFPGLLPEAAMFVLAAPMTRKDDTKAWNIKTRRGSAFVKGHNFKDMEMPDDWGGRWNAGGNKRMGGYFGDDPRDYAMDLVRRYEELSKR